MDETIAADQGTRRRVTCERTTALVADSVSDPLEFTCTRITQRSLRIGVSGFTKDAESREKETR